MHAIQFVAGAPLERGRDTATVVADEKKSDGRAPYSTVTLLARLRGLCDHITSLRDMSAPPSEKTWRLRLAAFILSN